MTAYVIRKILTGLLVLLLASVVVFAFLRFTRGDPAALIAGPDATPDAVARIRHELGLDESGFRQYFTWLSGLLHGDLGRSYFSNEPVSSVISRGLSSSGALAGLALVLAVLFAVPLGIAGAVSRSRAARAVLSAVTTVSLAVPTYVTGVVFVLIFSIYLPVFPAGGYVPLLSDPLEGLRSLVLPALCLAIPVSAVLARYLKSALLEVLDQEYILAARLRGIGPTRLLLRNALPNAVPSTITVLGVQAGQILGGAIVIEALFAWPGLGNSVLQAVLNHDYPLVQGLLLLAVATFIAIQVLTDVVHAAVDPTIGQGVR